MAENNFYDISDNPVYDTEIRKLRNDDPANAETVFNPLFKQIINNIHAVKLGNEKLIENHNKSDTAHKEIFNSENELRESEYEGYFKIKEGSQDYQCGISFRAPNNLDDAPADRKLYHNYIRVTSSVDYFYETDVLIVWIDTFSENTWYHKSKKVEFEGHLHTKSQITDFPASLKNPYSLTIQGNGTTLTNGTYDGSVSKTVNITPSSIGAAVGKAVSSDFNTIKTQGLYCVNSSVNAPINYTHWSLIVLNSTSIGGNYIHQIAFKENTAKGYIRQCYANAWGNWRKFDGGKYSEYDCVIAAYDSSSEDKAVSDIVCPEDNARQTIFNITTCYYYKKIIFLNGTYNINIDTDTIIGSVLSPSGVYPKCDTVGLRINAGQTISFGDKVILNFQTARQFSKQVNIIELYNTGDSISVFNDSKEMRFKILEMPTDSGFQGFAFYQT